MLNSKSQYDWWESIPPKSQMFIKVTDLEGKSHMINVDYITDIVDDKPNSNQSRIKLSNKTWDHEYDLLVEESVSEIYKKLKNFTQI